VFTIPVLRHFPLQVPSGVLNRGEAAVLANSLQRMPSGNIYDGFPCVRVGDFLLPSSMDLRTLLVLQYHRPSVSSTACGSTCWSLIVISEPSRLQFMRGLPLQGGTWMRCRRLANYHHTQHSVWAPCCVPPAWQPRRLLQRQVGSYESSSVVH
jgi:hypothetical protein